MQHTLHDSSKNGVLPRYLEESFLFAVSSSLDGRTRSTQPAPSSFRNLTSFQTRSRRLCSLADGSFAFPCKPLAFPFHNMDRAASAKSLLCRIGLCCDSSQGRSDRLRQTRQKCRIFSVASCACFHKLAPFSFWMPCLAEQGSCGVPMHLGPRCSKNYALLAWL